MQLQAGKDVEKWAGGIEGEVRWFITRASEREMLQENRSKRVRDIVGGDRAGTSLRAIKDGASRVARQPADEVPAVRHGSDIGKRTGRVVAINTQAVR